ncbi:TPA: hypothetical protein JL163_003388 [Escherichia coli]|uniref:hypothetical protein n=1 Tax=Escherichia coli TaxID=562 RepID=UPI0003EF1632|nr:hypothetical protein [Escherichia coli]EID6869032.1 hypothetical protein [Escherichia coli]HAW5727949.1 hypothetical protein [Escherichia coli]
MGFLETIAESHRFASLGCFVFLVLLVLLVYQLLKMIIAKSTRFNFSIKLFKYEITITIDDGKTN